MHAEEQDSSPGRMNCAVSISADRDHFFRRACPSCSREFKTQLDPSDLQWELEAQFRRMGVEIGEGASDTTRAEDRIKCPFCDHGMRAARCIRSKLWST